MHQYELMVILDPSIDERTACLAEEACYWNVDCNYGAI